MKKFIVALAIGAASAFAWALPTVQQVEAEIQQGRTVQAESMMGEVVAAKPASAKAHYIYAEILARNKKFAKASEEARTARQLDPDLKFTQPEKFRAFEQLLEKEQRAPARIRAPAQRRSSLPPPAAPKASQEGIPSWVWAAGLAVVGFAIWRVVASRGDVPTRAAGLPAAVGTPNVPVNVPGNPGVPFGPGMPQAPAPGGGLLGTGLAAAGGVAGGMLLGEMLRGKSGNNANPGAGGQGLANVDPLQSASAATELETRQVDFGNGNEWDSGTASGDGGSGADGGGNWE